MRALLPLLASLILAASQAPAAAPLDYVEELNFYNTDLHLVLKALSEKTGNSFVEDIPVEGKVTIHISKRTPIADVLDQLLRGLNLAWRLEGGAYHIGVKPPPKGVPPGKGLVSRTYSLETIAAEEAAEAVRPLLSEYGKVIPDYGMNSITVTDIPEIHEGVRPMLTNMDVEGRQTPQVNIQIKILQVDRTGQNDTNASLSWNKYNANEGLASIYSEPLNNVQGWGNQFDGWPGSNLWDSWVQQDEYYAYYNKGLSFKAGWWGIDEVLMRFFAVIGINRLNLLSEPDMTVLDGQEATITLGEKLPLITSGGGFQYQDTGIILKATPKVGPEGVISLSLNPQVTERSSELFKTVNFLNTREVQTQVEVVSGGTVRIGGLLMTQTIKTESKLPVLGDLPLLGMLFRKTSVTETKKELVILVSPHIVEKIPPRCATTAGISALKAGLVAGTTNVLLDWAEDVPFDNVGVVRYNVYRDTRPITGVVGMNPLSREVRGDLTSWVDHTFKRRGVTYYYAVTAMDGAGNEQSVSNSPSVEIPRR